jgi:hypothetical protein
MGVSQPSRPPAPVGQRPPPRRPLWGTRDGRGAVATCVRLVRCARQGTGRARGQAPRPRHRRRANSRLTKMRTNASLARWQGSIRPATRVVQGRIRPRLESFGMTRTRAVHDQEWGEGGKASSATGSEVHTVERGHFGGWHAEGALPELEGCSMPPRGRSLDDDRRACSRPVR